MERREAMTNVECQQSRMRDCRRFFGFEGCGAGNGIRTRDPQLGKLMLYQLSYSRLGRREPEDSGPPWERQARSKPESSSDPAEGREWKRNQRERRP